MLAGNPPRFKGKCSRCGGERNGARRYCKPCEAMLARERYARVKERLERLEAIESAETLVSFTQTA